MGYKLNWLTYNPGFISSLISTLTLKFKLYILNLEKKISNPYCYSSNLGELARSVEYARKIENSLFGIQTSTRPFNFQRDLYMAAVARTGKLIVSKPSFWCSSDFLFVKTSERQRKTNAVPKKPSRNIYKSS